MKDLEAIASQIAPEIPVAQEKLRAATAQAHFALLQHGLRLRIAAVERRDAAMAKAPTASTRPDPSELATAKQEFDAANMLVAYARARGARLPSYASPAPLHLTNGPAERDLWRALLPELVEGREAA